MAAGAKPSGYRVRYGAFRALEADHAAYLVHGGLVVPVRVPDAPAPDQRVLVRIEAPDGAGFTLSARSGRFIAGRGFMATFEADAAPARRALEAYLESPPFRQAAAREPASLQATPTVFLAGDAEVATWAPAPASDGGDFEDEDTLPPLPPGGAPAGDDGDLAGLEDALDGGEDDDPPTMDDAVDDVESLTGPRRGGLTPPSRQAAPLVTASDPGGAVDAPRPGETYPVYAVRFGGVRAFVAILDRFRREGRLELPHAETEAAAGSPARLRLTLPGHNVFEMWAELVAVTARAVDLRVGLEDESFRKALAYPETIAARGRLAAEKPGEADELAVSRLTEQVPEDDDEKMPLRRRISRMGMEDKINLALSGNREERMALAMDSNRAIHHYLLKNAKLTLDELAFMARLPSLNPDVLDKIAENPAYTQNPAVTRALVNNPKTPVQTAIRLLDRLPRSEVMNLAKRTSMNARLVMAAKKKLEGGR